MTRFGYSNSTRNPMRKRNGFTLTELIVAATLLVAMVGVVGPLTVRGGRLWQDSRHYRLAIDELTNHLERLSVLEEKQLAAAIIALEPSPSIRDVLPNPQLGVETVSDADGKRLILRLSWDRPGAHAPVTLVGWIDELSPDESSGLDGLGNLPNDQTGASR